MPKTHLPGHLDSVRQTIRPKHQVLINKCYPRLPKNSAADVKPNGSELSYLLYYASSRKSKLQKVGTYLERKTGSDVAKEQSARVFVTLQILTALLDNKAVAEGSGLALIAPYAMRIISDILQHTTDISLIEATQTTWSVFCEHQDQATLAAEHEYRELYEHVVAQYAQLAHNGSSKKIGKSATLVATHDAIRLREIGLHATKSVLTSDALAFESGRTVLTTTIPEILGNLVGDGVDDPAHLVRVGKRAEQEEKNRAMTLRQSMATIRTFSARDTSAEADPRAAEGTAQDADALAEENVALVALDCLKAAFATDNRAQVRSATTEVLHYLSGIQYFRRPISSDLPHSDLATNTWATKVFELCTAWTPVQDRFILLVTAVEMLVRIPSWEDDMKQHLLYTSVIQHILASDLNLIGLSVMDVLLQLIQHTLRLLQLSGPPATVTSQSTPNNEGLHHASPAASDGMPSVARRLLMERLRYCVRDLATHIYYTDQVSDMIAAILLRLKPNSTPSGQQVPAATAAAIEEPKAAVNDVAANIGLTTRPRSSSNTSGYFSFDTAREFALQVVHDILKQANSPQTKNTGGVAESRNRVQISVWEGTEWLLKDPCPDVRTAYLLALMTWLQLETDESDARLLESKPLPKKPRQTDGNQDVTALARRAASNASARFRNRETKAEKQTFLELLHVANYDNALQYAATSSAEMVQIQVLLTALVRHMGLNALASGLPMIFALQEDIARLESPVAKVELGSLVHGYLVAVVYIYDCPELVSEKVWTEIERRKSKGLWASGMTYPPISVEEIENRKFSIMSRITEESVAKEELKPFDDRAQLVDAVVEGYQRQHQEASVGQEMRMHLMREWTREECMKRILAMAPKSASVSGSRTSPRNAAGPGVAGGHHRQLLAAPSTRRESETSSEAARPLPKIDDLRRALADPVFSTLAGGPRRPKVDVVALLESIPVEEERRPKIAIGRPPYY